ncbi:MAG: XRE family transcriptional regulator [Lachnospiraceae bacterium]|nr:XRE family transcriptional regulator [Lachnospiraceae bacterium]
MGIGERISERRHQIKMSVEAFARRTNVTPDTVLGWEEGRLIPETTRLTGIAHALNTNVGYLLEDDPIHKRWQLNDRMFSEDNMYKFIERKSRELNYQQTRAALEFMKKSHEGQYRKGADKVPYINHPLLMACHAFAVGVAEDSVIATCLLHDVVEDCGVQAEELPVSREAREAVLLLSFEKQEGLTKEESKEQYYENIKRSKIASIVKCLDRCNNISGMATAFSREKMANYIDETEKYVIPILDNMKYQYPEYNTASFLLKYHMRSVLETLKHVL